MFSKNWGLGWHVFLAYAGTIWGHIIVLACGLDIAWSVIIPFFIISAIGIWYEINQGKQPDTGQDLIGNFSGQIFGILTIIGIDKLL